MALSLVEIITIGDEILYGQIQDTNATWLSQQFSQAGFKVIWRSTIGDVKDHLLQAFKQAESRADIILITGGLGPTADDLTKPTLNEYFGSKLIRNKEVINHLSALFASRGRELTEVNARQADLPEACELIPNAKGTAPGMWFRKENKVFISLPGVPFEMKNLVSTIVLPRLQQEFAHEVIYHRKIRTSGIPESILSEKIKDWEQALPQHMGLAYLPHLGMVDLRITATGQNLEELQKEVNKQEIELIPQIEKYIYGYGDEELAQSVGKLLVSKGLKISTAESCTAGYIAHMLTSQAGSSAYFIGRQEEESTQGPPSPLKAAYKNLKHSSIIKRLPQCQQKETIATRFKTVSVFLLIVEHNRYWPVNLHRTPIPNSFFHANPYYSKIHIYITVAI